jgi:hypothetical protein
VLSAHTETPEVAETTVRPDLLEALKVITQLRVHIVGQNLRILSVNNVTLTVQEPQRDLELSGILNNRHKPLQFVRVEVARSEVFD